MAESVVVIHTPGEEAAARGLCAAIEARGGAVWSPLRATRETTLSELDAQISNAIALVVLTRDALQHSRQVELAAKRSVAVVIALPDEASDAWSATLAELQLAGAIDTVASGAKAAEFNQPRVYIADDEEKHIEFIAENVSEAQVFIRFGLFDKAVSRLRTVLERAPRNLEAHDELLKIYLEENEHDNAAAIAADYLDSLLFRGEEAAYAMLRSHLLSHGFAVDDGPPVAVGAAGGVFRTTRFHAGAPVQEAPAAKPAPAPAARSVAEAESAAARLQRQAVELAPLELPILRNFRAGQPALEALGVEADLGGIDFLFEHGLLDEARMRIEQMLHEHPDHPGVLERKQKIDAIAGPRSGLGLSLALDDDWGAPASPAPAPRAEASRPAAPLAMTAAPRATAVLTPEPTAPPAELVCSIFCPLAVDEGDSFAIQVWIHPVEQTEAEGVALVEDRREAAVLSDKVSAGDSLVLSLSLPQMEVLGSSQLELAWEGAADCAAFSVVAPAGTAESRVEGWLAIERDGEKLGEVPLRVRIA